MEVLWCHVGFGQSAHFLVLSANYKCEVNQLHLIRQNVCAKGPVFECEAPSHDSKMEGVLPKQCPLNIGRILTVW